MKRVTMCGLCALAITLMVTVAWGGNLINNVPDWHQPCLIGAPNGPDNGGNPAAGQACYKAWCVPTAAADIMGYWRDVKGCNAIADATPYVSGTTIPWAPPVPTDWQDDAADATSIPLAGGGFRVAGADLGWYLNTNDQGDQTLPGAAGGGAFSGTKTAAIQQGLTNYLAVHGYGTATVTQAACNNLVGWGVIKTEIDAGRPLMGLFVCGAFSQLGGTEDPNKWKWDPSYDPNDTQTGEDWGPGGNGHAMTIVGYLNSGDAGNPYANTDTIIVQDNRRHWVNGAWEADNVLGQIALPFYDVGQQQNVAPWTGYVSVNVPEPATLSLLGAGSLLAVLRRRRR